MVKEAIIMPNTAEYPFSSAVRAGDYIFLSGNGGVVDKDGRKVKGIGASGGNKCRCFEFILAEAKKQGADAVISRARSQSNWCLQLAAAGRKLGMKASFV